MNFTRNTFKSLSIIVMAYNEVDSLEIVVSEIIQALEKICPRYEIIIVDDGSSDGTSDLSDHLANTSNKINVIHHPINRGLGGVYRTGIENANSDYVTFIPADGQFPPRILRDYLPHMYESDMIIGYIPNRRDSLSSRSLSLLEKLFYRLLFGSFPKLQGVLMFRTDLREEIKLISSGRGWAVVMELVMKASKNGYTLLEMPNELRPRISGSSKVNNLNTVYENFKEALLLRWRLND